LSLIAICFAYNEAGVAPSGQTSAAENRKADLLETQILQCLNATTCDSCLSQSNCGWCQGKKCVPGGESGPYTGSCNSWSFDYCPNQATCGHTTCTSCLDDADCGWCSTDKHCLPGNASSPLEGYCSSANYFYTECPGGHQNSVEVDLSFPFNGRSDCDVCGVYGYYICCNGYSVLYNSTMFLDPTPFGSVVTQVKIAVTGVYTTSSVGYQLTYNFNNYTSLPMVLNVPANTPGNACNAQCVTYNAETEMYPTGIPGYANGGYNFIGFIDCGVNYNCMTEIAVTVVYNDASDAQQTVKVGKH